MIPQGGGGENSAACFTYPFSKGFDFPMGQGDIRWDRVREELAKIQYHGWVTAEVRGGDRQRLAEISAEMTKILGL